MKPQMFFWLFIAAGKVTSRYFRREPGLTLFARACKQPEFGGYRVHKGV